MPHTDVVQLAADLVRIDSRSFVSNLPVAERIEALSLAAATASRTFR